MLRDCIWAVVEEAEGRTICSLLESGNWTCYDCMDILEKQEERKDKEAAEKELEHAKQHGATGGGKRHGGS